MKTTKSYPRRSKLARLRRFATLKRQRQVLAVRCDSQVCVLEAIPGKGMGMVAKLPIVAGSLLSWEKPLMDSVGCDFRNATRNFEQLSSGMLSKAEKWKLEREIFDPLLQPQFITLAQSQKSSIFTLCDSYAEGADDKTLIGIWFTNAVERGEGSSESVLGLSHSRFNSSCRPNALTSWLKSEDIIQVRAICDIAQGEEICVCYINPCRPTKERQAKLLSNMKFTCQCQLCSVTDAASDARRGRFAVLEKKLGNIGHKDPKRGLGMALEMLSLFHEDDMRSLHELSHLLGNLVQLSLSAGSPIGKVRHYITELHNVYRKGWGPKGTPAKGGAKMMLSLLEKPPQNEDDLAGRIEVFR